MVYSFKVRIPSCSDDINTYYDYCKIAFSPEELNLPFEKMSATTLFKAWQCAKHRIVDSKYLMYEKQQYGWVDIGGGRKLRVEEELPFDLWVRPLLWTDENLEEIEIMISLLKEAL